MALLNGKEVSLIEKLIQLNQKQIHKVMKKYLKQFYPEVYVTKKYIIALGTIPVGIVAHMDTVFDKLKKANKARLFYDREKEVMFSPDGAGFDDRAGIFLIIRIIQNGYRPTIILTTDEEIGADGALAITKDFYNAPIKLNYLIELDRCGDKDCVFYECDNKKFNNYIKNFDFEFTYGSFSDISIIGPAWGLAAVNLSVGYEEEHSYSEHLKVNSMLDTYHKVINILSQKDFPKFNYIQGKTFYHWFSNETKCDCCGKSFEDWELIPLKEGELVKFYCSDCCDKNNINWCANCGSTFKAKNNETMCEDCLNGEH